ncbi:MAG: hypothetical protein KDI17_16195 [Halioglobus sp.]|nr:hypothetical protein [Halioglobus sp.]
MKAELELTTSFRSSFTGKMVRVVRQIRARSRVLELERSAGDSVFLVTPTAEHGSKQIVVSLTTYGPRLYDVHLVLESIAQQTMKPNRVILWLDEAEYQERDVPIVLQHQMERGLEVRFCHNLRSYKKLIPTLKICPDATIITIDDDILYPKDMLEQLVTESQRFPNTVIAHRARRIGFNEARLAPYREWEYVSSEERPSSLTLPIGIGGVLYPPGIFHHDVFVESKFMSLASNADDIWFKAMSLLCGVKCKKTNDARTFYSRFFEIPGSQLNALHHTNLLGQENDVQIASVFGRYQLYDLLWYEAQSESASIDCHVNRK